MNNNLVSQRDPDIERRRSLVKVYMLLLRLADEAEKKKATSEAAEVTNQRVEVSAPVREGLSSQ